MANDNDYGYFGKGIDGYVHYNQAFENNKKITKRRNSGCLTAVLTIIAVIAALSCFLLMLI